MNEERTTTEKLDMVSRKILLSARGELYMKMRFLDVALSCMPFIPDTGADGMGTDGLYLYYVPGRPRYGEPDLSASGTAWYLPAYAPEKGKRRADLSSGLRHCGRIHHRRASVPLCDEGQVSSEKRDVPDAEEGNEDTDGRTGI